jgi:hypothetical protein
MSQAETRNTSRRRFLQTAAAAVPTVAVPALAGSSILPAAARVEQAWQRLSAACDVKNIAENAMLEWKKQNPKPPAPSSSEDDLREGETRRDCAVRILLRAFDGPSIEWQEFTKASEAWEVRYEEAKHPTGIIRAEELESAAGAELEALPGATCNPARSCRGPGRGP